MSKQVVNMRDRLAGVRWALVLTTAVVVYIVTLLLGLVVSFPVLAFLSWFHLDSASAIQASSLITAFLVIVVTSAGAWWVARRVGQAALLHGLLVGLVVALLSFLLDLLFLRAIRPVGLALYVLMVAAGVLGGVLAGREQAQA